MQILLFLGLLWGVCSTSRVIHRVVYGQAIHAGLRTEGPGAIIAVQYVGTLGRACLRTIDHGKCAGIVGFRGPIDLDRVELVGHLVCLTATVHSTN